MAYLLERLKGVINIDEIIVATTEREADRAIIDLAATERVASFAGSEADVLDRYYKAAQAHHLDHIVRITADCPLIDRATLETFVSVGLANQGLDYLGTSPSWPEGYDMEFLTFAALERTWREAKRKSDREHVTPYIRRHEDEFKTDYLDCPYGDLSWLRVTIDEEIDLEVVGEIVQKLYPHKPDFGLTDVLALVKQAPSIIERNRHVQRNEGYERSLIEETKEARRPPEPPANIKKRA